MAARKPVAIISSLPGVTRLSNLIGDRGERIFELAITDYEQFRSPLFKPGFLGEQWPSIDYYVELLGVRGCSPFFFAQVKSTTRPLSDGTDVIEINVNQKKCESLFRIPGPTYIVGVHEPAKKAYIRSVHGRPQKGIYRIPLEYELTPDNLKLLHREVREFWNAFPHKPTESHFK